MIRNGFARYNGESFDGSDAFAEAESKARSEGKGIWQDQTDGS